MYFTVSELIDALIDEKLLDEKLTAVVCDTFAWETTCVDGGCAWLGPTPAAVPGFDCTAEGAFADWGALTDFVDCWALLDAAEETILEDEFVGVVAEDVILDEPTAAEDEEDASFEGNGVDGWREKNVSGCCIQ